MNIVSDGTKEMTARFNISKNSKKRKEGWINLVNELDDYRRKMKSGLIHVLVADFKGPVDVKFGGVRMEKEETKKLKEFMNMVKMSNTEMYKEHLLDRVESLRCLSLVDLNVVVIKREISYCHDRVIERMELYIRSIVMETQHSMAQERSKLESTIFNFVEGEIPDDIKQLFKNGTDAVPDIKMGRKMVKDRVEGALLNYLEIYRSRHSHEGHIDADGVLEWLDKVKGQAVDVRSQTFYKDVEDGYTGLMAEIDLVYTEYDAIDTVDEIRNKLEKNGCTIIQCDKNFGMSIFTLKMMKIADKKLMEQLGAIEVDKSKEDIIESVYEKIEEFEKGLNEKQTEYINYAYSNRDVKSVRSKIVFPFLKSVHKVHKMTEQEIKEKNTKVLKFRPIVDARRWVTSRS